MFAPYLGAQRETAGTHARAVIRVSTSLNR
jgi:hypothetical protein